jgi:hypothetical protein
MARETDAELIESVRVRRRRLGEAFLGGTLGVRRTVTDNLTRAMIGLVLAAVICAGCAATSFIRAHTGSSSGSSATPSPAGSVATGSTP